MWFYMGQLQLFTGLGVQAEAETVSTGLSSYRRPAGKRPLHREYALLWKAFSQTGTIPMCAGQDPDHVYLFLNVLLLTVGIFIKF